MGGRGSGGGGIPFSTPGGGSVNKRLKMDMKPGDPETLAEALGGKGRMSTKNAVMGANPFYDSSREEYSYNCQRCVAATEARFRGYDVIASPTYEGDTMPANGNWMNNFVGAKSSPVTGSNPAALQRSLESQMAGYGDGSRAILRVGWKGTRGSGHVINVVQKKGKTYYFDGQTGNQYHAKDLFSAVSTRGSNTSYVVRVDNLPFSESAKAAFRQNPARKK